MVPFKVHITQFFIALCERTSKTVQFIYTFAILRFVDEIFQFVFFVLPTY